MRTCILCLLALHLCGCTGNGYTVTGTNGMLPGDTVFLFGSDGAVLGCSPIAADSTFSIEGDFDKPDIALLCDRERADRPIRLLIEPGTIRIAAGTDGAEVSGTPLNDSLQRIAHRLDSLRDESAARPLDTGERMQLRRLRDSLLCTAIRTHRDNLLGAYFLSLRIADTDPEDSTRLAAWLVELERLPAALRTHPVLQPLRDRSEAVANTRIGQPCIELALPDIDGRIRPLSALTGRGGWVLVDFRASWCRNCMGELSWLEDLYDTYGASGFEIYTVWLDNDPYAWKHTIRLTNPAGTNVRGTDPEQRSEAARRYGIVDLPANFLISPEGIIHARNLDVTELSDILERNKRKLSE